MSQSKGIPELLAPAGNLECALTAYKYGADAVYAGLGRFNAREMGKNFSYEDMSKLSAYSKKTGRRFYLTLNTLVKETELEELISFLDKVKQLEPDAIIIQDLGVLNILKRWYPEIPVHGSTQMGFHNLAGLFTADRLGLERVILERQVSLEEIKMIVPDSPLEVEVFIHGALCCGLSGHCLFSSWIGGWSGNRGRCKQPCRRRYHGTYEGEKVSGFFFSPQDLYTLDILGELKDAGIASLKIEGRLKQPDYIRNVVSAYRKILDAEAGREKEVLGEARNVLSGSFGRKWSHGFYIPDEMEELLQYDSMGVSGQLVGVVNQTKPSGFSVKLSRRIHLGDRLRVQPKSGEEGPAMTVTRLSLVNRNINTGRKGDTVFVHCDKEIPSGGMVYKIGESRKDTLPEIGNLPLHSTRMIINLAIHLDSQGLSVTAEIPGADDSSIFEMSWNEPPEPAGNKPLDRVKLVELFSATRNPEIRAGKITTEILGEWFIPASHLKKRRREFWDKLSLKIVIKDNIPDTQLHYPEKIDESTPGVITHLFSRKKISSGLEDSFSRIGKRIIASDSVSEVNDDIEEIILPHFCPENKLPDLKDKISAFYNSGIRRFRVTGLYQFELLKDLRDLIITTAFPLPAANTFAVLELSGLGVNRVQAWIELEKRGLIEMKKHSPLPLELYFKGKPFLLATRAPVRVEGLVSDSRGSSFLTRRDKASGLTYIYPRKIMKIAPIEGYDIYHEDVNGEGESDFNFEQEWV